jgi:hypothetical protein
MTEDHVSLKDEIQDFVEILGNESFAAAPQVVKLAIIADELTSAFRHFLDHILAADRDELIEVATWAFDTYFVPYDLPINDWFETIGEANARAAIPAAVDAFIVWAKEQYRE